MAGKLPGTFLGNRLIVTWFYDAAGRCESQPQAFGVASDPQQPCFVSGAQHVCKGTESQHAGAISRDGGLEVRSLMASPFERKGGVTRGRTHRGGSASFSRWLRLPVRLEECMSTPTTETLKAAVRQAYAEIATGKTSSGCCSGAGCCGTSRGTGSQDIGYSDEERRSVPEGADLGLGCGNPQTIDTSRRTPAAWQAPLRCRRSCGC